MFRALSFFMLWTLVACAPAPLVPTVEGALPDWTLRYSAAAPQTVYRVQPELSNITMYAFRAGLAARLGHNHVLSVPQFEGAVALPSDAPQDAFFDLRFNWTDVVIDDPVLRREIGGQFTAERSQADRDGTRANLLGEQGVQAERYPSVHLLGRVAGGDWPMLIAAVTVTLKGVSRLETLPIQVTRDGDRLRAQGVLHIKQSDYGITPFSALGGLMAVQDDVVIRFGIVASK